MKTTICTFIILLSCNISFAENSIINIEKTEGIHKIIRNYLINNPEILIEINTALHEKQQKEIITKAEKVIPEKKIELLNSNSPNIGLADAQVNLITFFDYQCGYCRESAKIINRLIKQNKSNLNVIFKEFPIFGYNSEITSKAALAADKQGKYNDFYNELMIAELPLNKEKLDIIAIKVGLNINRWRDDMNSEEVAQELEKNITLTNHIGIYSTPTFIITNNISDDNFKAVFHPSSANIHTLQNIISNVQS